MSLYASDKVITQMRKLLEKQTELELNSLIICMRKDLYGVRTVLDHKVFKL